MKKVSLVSVWLVVMFFFLSPMAGAADEEGGIYVTPSQIIGGWNCTIMGRYLDSFGMETTMKKNIYLVIVSVEESPEYGYSYAKMQVYSDNSQNYYLGYGNFGYYYDDEKIDLSLQIYDETWISYDFVAAEMFYYPNNRTGEYQIKGGYRGQIYYLSPYTQTWERKKIISWGTITMTR